MSLFRNSSFKFHLLSTIILSHAIISIVLVAVVLVNFHEETKNVFAAQEDWLRVYSKTFLNDIETGNTFGVERKLRILVDKQSFSHAVIEFGNNSQLEAGTAHRGEGSAPRTWLAKLLVPSEIISVPVMDDSQTRWADLKVTVDAAHLTAPIVNSFFNLIRYGMAIFLIVLGGLLLIVEYHSRALNRLTDYIARFSKTNYDPTKLGDLLAQEPQLRISEWRVLRDEFRRSVENITALQEDIERQRLEAEKSHIAAQVAHDIRSPLTALTVAIGDSLSLPEENRVLIRTAVNRIRDIANDLLEKYKAPSRQSPPKSPQDTQLELIPSLMESVVSEMRIQHAKDDVRIEYTQGPDCYDLFSSVEKSAFHRILANLIKNAAEAIEGPGHILIWLQKAQDAIVISVTDNGKGIPAEVIPRLTQRGETYGKKHGHGLGLSYAHQVLKGWGGSLRIQSQLGRGTTVTVGLKRQPPPSWFVPELELTESTEVIVLDDDLAVHEVWKQRFRATGNSHVPMRHFAHQREFEAWFQGGGPQEGKRYLYLVDQELLRSPQNGLDVIRKHGLAEKAILVTSLFDDDTVREQSAELGIGCIPKPMAGYVPITFRPAG